MISNLVLMRRTLAAAAASIGLLALSAMPIHAAGQDTPHGPTPDAHMTVPAQNVTVLVYAARGRAWISAKDHAGDTIFDGLLERDRRRALRTANRLTPPLAMPVLSISS